MNYPPPAVLPRYSNLQESHCASCEHASNGGAHLLVMGDAMSVPTSATMPPHPVSTSFVQILLTSMLAIFYYSMCFLGLHHVWFSAYCLVPNARTLDLEHAPNFRRSCWTETVKKMNRVWTLITMGSSLLMTLSVAVLQIDNIVENTYPRTFTILAFILSSASLAASSVFLANGASLNCEEKFRKWEIASQNLNTLSSVDLWACLALPLTSLTWSAGFCSMTLFSFSWVDQGAIPAPTSKVDLGFTIALVSFALLCLAVQFYRLRKLLAKGSAFDAHP